MLEMLPRILPFFLGFLLLTQGCSARHAPESPPDHWALLIAGSMGWWNYRHQADVLHAYQVLTAKGVKPENIVVMVYDDIANAKYNPFPGQMFNKPNGSDVYKGVPLDYTGKDVNVDVFLGVLAGEHRAVKGSGSGKVIRAGPNDRVFVYYSDHGAAGLICMPTGEDLYADQLHKVLKERYAGGSHGELVFYLEACESGSMFDGLTSGLNLFATTAANPFESSWAFYCPGDSTTAGDENVPSPDTIGACLGDEYSVHWLEDADASDLTIETLKQQYKRVKELTQESHVMHYGRGSIEVEEASNFIGITEIVPPSSDVDSAPEEVRDEDREEDEPEKEALGLRRSGASLKDPTLLQSTAPNQGRRRLSSHSRNIHNADTANMADTDDDAQQEAEVGLLMEHEAAEHYREQEFQSTGDKDEDNNDHDDVSTDERQDRKRASGGNAEEEEDEDDKDKEELRSELLREGRESVRVPQRDAELIGMYATLRRNNLAPELRQQAEAELITFIESRRTVDDAVWGSAQRLLLSSNGRLIQWLSQHMSDKDEVAAGSVMAANRNGLSDSTQDVKPLDNFSVAFHAYTRQVLYGGNGRPSVDQPLVDDWDCLRAMVQVWKEATNIWDNGAKRHTRYFANLCNAGITALDFAHSLAHRVQAKAGGSTTEV